MKSIKSKFYNTEHTQIILFCYVFVLIFIFSPGDGGTMTSQVLASKFSQHIVILALVCIVKGNTKILSKIRFDTYYSGIFCLVLLLYTWEKNIR